MMNGIYLFSSKCGRVGWSVKSLLHPATAGKTALTDSFDSDRNFLDGPSPLDKRGIEDWPKSCSVCSCCWTSPIADFLFEIGRSGTSVVEGLLEYIKKMIKLNHGTKIELIVNKSKKSTCCQVE